MICVCNSKVDECRRRIQYEMLAHRGSKYVSLYRIRRLTMAKERLDADAKVRLLGLLRSGDPKVEPATRCNIKEAVCQMYTIADPNLAAERIDSLTVIMCFPY